LADLYAHFTDALRAIVEAILHSPLPIPEEDRYQGAQHAALVDAIEAGDPDAAQRCVRTYLSISAASVQRLREADA
jgi:DNA-binding FadR family transcriptional regulator